MTTDNTGAPALTEEELTRKYLTLGKIFEEIIAFPDAALYIKLHFDINVDSDKKTITVVHVPDSESAKRISASLEDCEAVSPKIIVP